MTDLLTRPPEIPRRCVILLLAALIATTTRGGGAGNVALPDGGPFAQTMPGAYRAAALAMSPG